MSTTATETAPAASLAERLKALKQRTDGTLQKPGIATTLKDRVEAITKDAVAVAEVSNDSEREAQLKIIRSRFADVRKDMAKDTADYGDLIVNLGDMFSQLSAEHAALQEPNAEEKAMLAEAQAAVEAAEADTRKTGFGSKLFKARREEALAAAKARLTEVEREVKRHQRDRLKNAKTEESMQQIITLTQQVKDMTDADKITTEAQMAEAGAYRVKAQTDLVTFTAESDELAKMKEQAQRDVTAQELKLRDTQKGTEAYSTEEQKLSDLNAVRSEIEGRHNVILARIRVTETFALEHEQDEVSLRATRSAQEIYSEMLRISIENRHQTVKAIMELERSFANIEAAATLKNIDAEVTRRQMTRAASIQAAVQNEIQASVDAMPVQLERARKIREASVEKEAEYRKHLQGAIDLLKQDNVVAA